MAVAVFPMAGGVNGAALRWSTAATLGAAAGRAAAAPPLPPIAGPFVLAAAPVPVRVQLVSPAAAAVVGLPLVAALDKMKSDTLGSMLSALMQACDPPAARQRQIWAGPPPPWWPSPAAEWWGPEVAAHLHTIPVHTPVPFAPAYKLNKVQKVAALVAVVKHLSPDFDGIAMKVRRSAKLTVQEDNLWKGALANEAARRKAGSAAAAAAAPVAVPAAVFSVILQHAPPPPPHGEAHRLLAPDSRAAAAENVVHGGGEQVANLAVGNNASVAAPEAGDGGQVMVAAAAAAEPEEKEGQNVDGVLEGGAMDGDGGGDLPVDVPGVVNNGAAAAADDFDQLLDDMLAPYQVQKVQVQEVHQVVDAEAPGAEEAAEVALEAPGAEEAAQAAPEGRPWYVEGDMTSIFDNFEMPV
ncbi:unnamed protein product [Urochloa humidicola]